MTELEGHGGGLRPAPSPTDIAWAAGLFEGEGCWNAYRQRSGKMQVQARLAMTDADVVEKFASIMGFGSVRVRPARNEREKPLTEWSTQRRANVRTMVDAFRPHLGARRLAKGEEILALGEAQPHKERPNCPQGHPYSGDNLRLEEITRNGRTYFARRCRACRTAQDRERKRALVTG